ncbi:MAG: iron-containing alcohol dehydrogenase [Planctomycetia bacterium]|nr:iron-containing alcohol dehydrogenase [Planctomycetia bacterium]
MQNFTYFNPVRIEFGEGCIQKIGKDAAQYGKKALLVYGQGSVVRNGILKQVTDSLDAAGVEYVVFSGVKANPVASHTREGIKLAKQEGCDMIVAVGGGSVIDESKAISAGACVAHDFWDFYSGKETVKTALPVLDVLTVAATGTEMNGGAVITNEETKEKLGIVVQPLHPKVSYLDPCVTFTLGKQYTAYAGVDIISHMLEGYLTNDDPYCTIQDGYVEGVMRAVMDAVLTCVENPKDYQARAAMMWGSTLAWNGVPLLGLGNYGYPCHMLGHSMSCLYDTAHGASLSVVTPAWMEVMADKYQRKLAKFCRNVFREDISCPKEAAQKAAVLFRTWCRKIGAPVTLAEIGLSREDIPSLRENITFCAPTWGMPEYDEKLVTELLEHML